MEQRVVKMCVCRENSPMYAEEVLFVEVEDEAAGEFVVVRSNLPDDGKISFNPETWPALRSAIDKLVKNCRPERGG